MIIPGTLNHPRRYLAPIGLTVFAALALSTGAHAQSQSPTQTQTERGKYLVTLGGCTDCHTPGHFLGKPDMALFLAGSDVAFDVPGLGAFAGPNLTPDNETGLGKWTTAQLVATMQTGKRPDGRMLAPAMPWRSLAALSQADVTAIAVYLKSLPPVKRKVAGPFAPGEVVPTFVMRVLPPGQTASAAPK